MIIHIPNNVNTKCIEVDLNEWVKLTKDYPYPHIVQQRINSLFPRFGLTYSPIEITLKEGVFTVPPVHIVNKFCAICHASNTEPFETLHCNHEFHSSCLNRWIRINNTCPMCRTKIM